MMTSCGNNKKSGCVVGGKTVRACDSCVKRRARWYCTADDAFLCQSCDNSVHSANSLARRHDRVRLKTSSSLSLSSLSGESLPAWHRGFTRKRRTPRNSNNSNKIKHEEGPASSPLVPEISNDDANDEHLLYRVPIFDPLVAELCKTTATTATVSASFTYNDTFVVANDSNSSPPGEDSSETNAHAFLPTEMDLAEFAADVESLLGHGLENECDFGIEGLGFVDCEEKQYFDTSGRVKIELDEDEEEEEEEDDVNVNMKICWTETAMEIDITRPEPFELNFEDHGEYSPASCAEEVDTKPTVSLGISPEDAAAETEPNEEEKEEDLIKKKKKKKKILLSLDYDGVITAWASQGSPWTTGDRPDLDPDACWPDWMGTYGHQLHQQHHHYMDVSGIRGTLGILADSSREARVSRYREKRRTRLFSKKIRYEVRKLNAEKRPRMKGRFVKRASFVGPHFPMLK